MVVKMTLNRIKKHEFERPVDKVRYNIISRRIADKLGVKYPLGALPSILLTAAIISLMVVYNNDFSRDGVLYEL